MEEKNFVSSGTLYLVATPIGNMSDISLRAKNILENVDFIAAEDTRVTMKLLHFLNIKKELVSYYEHNKKERGIQIADRLKSGQSCALVTDAGTPAISDPGEDLVRLCSSENISVVSVPGPCAAITALTVSSLPTDKFVFEGFLPLKSKDRTERLNLLVTETRTMIMYEAPHKLLTTLHDLYKYFGSRKISICRELTKLNEEIIRTTLDKAIELFSAKDPRGEFVLVIEGCAAKESEHEYTNESILEMINDEINSGKSPSEAIKLTAQVSGIPKNEIYSLYLKMKN